MSKRNPNLQLKISTKKSDFRDALNSMDNTETLADTSSLCHPHAKRNSADLDGEKEALLPECSTPVFNFTDNGRSQDNTKSKSKHVVKPLLLDKPDQDQFPSDNSLSCGSKSDENENPRWINNKIENIQKPQSNPKLIKPSNSTEFDLLNIDILKQNPKKSFEADRPKDMLNSHDSLNKNPQPKASIGNFDNSEEFFLKSLDENQNQVPKLFGRRFKKQESSEEIGSGNHSAVVVTMSPLQRIRLAFNAQNQEETKAQTTGNSDGFNQSAFDRRQAHKARMREKLTTGSATDILGNPTHKIIQRASSYQEKKKDLESAKSEKAEGRKDFQNTDEDNSQSGSDSTSFDIESENELRGNVVRTLSQPNAEQSSEQRINSIKLRSSQMLASFHEAQMDNENFENNYIKGELVGSGMHSNVYKCFLITDTEKLNPFAAKITSYDDEEKKMTLIQEFHLGQKLKHSSIPVFHQYSDDEFKGEICIVMDYIKGKELSDIMKIDDVDTNFILDKQSIINYSFQLLNSIEYLHKNNIAHRDIKPSNLIIDNDNRLHLLDFNVSRDYSKCKMMSQTGKIEYNAPEILINNSYNELVDIWAAGISIYQMLTRTLPFYDENIVKLEQIIKNEQVDFEIIQDEEFNELLQFMLDRDPKSRWTATQCLDHPLFEDCVPIAEQELLEDHSSPSFIQNQQQLLDSESTPVVEYYDASHLD